MLCCETCIDRCQMDAIKIGEGDLPKWTVTGASAADCASQRVPSEAMSLKSKPESDRQSAAATGERLLHATGFG